MLKSYIIHIKSIKLYMYKKWYNYIITFKNNFIIILENNFENEKRKMLLTLYRDCINLKF